MKSLADIDEKIEDSKRKLEFTYKEHVDSVEQFVGMHYKENGVKKSTPTNLLELAVTIYERLLAARTPKCSVSTESPNLKYFAANFEIVLNQVAKEIRLGDTIRRAVKEAMFTMGVVKIGIAGADRRLRGRQLHDQRRNGQRGLRGLLRGLHADEVKETSWQR